MKNFCDGTAAGAFRANPGAKYADHARGNVALRQELASIFATRTTAEWVTFGQQANTPICPVNTVTTITQDPQFQARMPMRPYREAGTDLMPSPIKPIGEALPVPTIAAREAGRDTDRCSQVARLRCRAHRRTHVRAGTLAELAVSLTANGGGK